MWEMLSRKKPWKGYTQVQVIVAVGLKGEKLQPIPAAASITAEANYAEYSDLMLKCLIRESHDRPDMLQVRSCLETIKRAAEDAERRRLRATNKKSGSTSDQVGSSSRAGSATTHATARDSTQQTQATRQVDPIPVPDGVKCGSESTME